MFLALSFLFLEFCMIAGVPNRLSLCHGECVLIQDCPSAWEIVKKSPADITSEEDNVLKKAFCGFENNTVRICCDMVKAATHRNLGLLPKDCGLIDDDRVIGGTVAGIREFPWMALLSIRQFNDYSWACGATVISPRYVLTAAHCVKDLQLAGVRVGEHNLATDRDCQGGAGAPVLCVDRAQDIAIERVITHDEYYNDGKTRAHDIALIRLKKPIDFKKSNARPVCLPTSPDEYSRSLDGLRAVTPGWGLTESGINSEVLLKADVPIHPKDVCMELFEGSRVVARKRTSTATFLCAGVVGHDSCGGDSGGPLLVTGWHGGFQRYTQYGVVSFGDVSCAADRPSLYSNVPLDIGWVLDNLEP